MLPHRFRFSGTISVLEGKGAYKFVALLYKDNGARVSRTKNGIQTGYITLIKNQRIMEDKINEYD